MLIFQYVIIGIPLAIKFQAKDSSAGKGKADGNIAVQCITRHQRHQQHVFFRIKIFAGENGLRKRQRIALVYNCNCPEVRRQEHISARHGSIEQRAVQCRPDPFFYPCLAFIPARNEFDDRNRHCVAGQPSKLSCPMAERVRAGPLQPVATAWTRTETDCTARTRKSRYAENPATSLTKKEGPLSLLTSPPEAV